MRLWHHSRAKTGIALLACVMAISARAAAPIAWRTTWNDALFTQAAKEHRDVLSARDARAAFGTMKRIAADRFSTTTWR